MRDITPAALYYTRQIAIIREPGGVTGYARNSAHPARTKDVRYGKISGMQTKCPSPARLWFLAAVLAFLFSMLAANFPPVAIFGAFGVMTVFHLLWAIFFVPETKGRPLDESATRGQP